MNNYDIATTNEIDYMNNYDIATNRELDNYDTTT
jgi:hypothetical protein